MHFFICVVSVAPVRKEPSHRSEQVSQLLFGELCELLEKAEDFVKIKMVFDGYEGWCQASQLDETDEQESPTAQQLTGEWVRTILLNGVAMHIPFASRIPPNNMAGRYKIEYNSNWIDVSSNSFSEELVKKTSSIFLNTPYQWGGRSVFGIDCSGFTQLVFKTMQTSLLRDACQQVMQGDEVGFLEEVKCGDLAFFDNSQGKITHVGILLSSQTIIHASGKVRIDTIDGNGIINAETGKRTHQLRLIKRIR